jgi:hypothetical protein
MENYVATIDTRLGTNLENNACVDSLATGPEVVFMMAGPADGQVTWKADFDAVVYFRRNVDDECDSPCRGSSTTGTLEFDSGYHWEGEEIVWGLPFIIVDGLNGASGTISLVFDYGWNVPVNETSWGAIKSNYRTDPAGHRSACAAPMKTPDAVRDLLC